ncbi:MAG: hypothetical protein QOH48_1994 [Actinomycetota bacterium]|jgi:hypothetical protein|nr:hypothetical protein [Actinomycetota bacterium]
MNCLGDGRSSITKLSDREQDTGSLITNLSGQGHKRIS